MFFDYIQEKYPNSVFRLEVEAENEAALRLYKKCGFEILGIYKDLDFTPSEENDLRTFFVAKAIK
jgi:ribosomal protein S18 acetylase RimI-like enzyme